MPTLDRHHIGEIRQLITPYLRRTPVVTLDGRDLGAPALPLSIKLELLQHAGSFKTRGAFANLLGRPIPAAGVVAASGGNHGAAVAEASQRLGIRATIYLPTTSSPAKVARISAAGAELVQVGDNYSDALAASESFAANSGALTIHAFDQAETILGQGTLAPELLEQAGELDTILVAVGGGGLVSGVATWCAGQVRVVGVEPELSPTMTRALAAGAPVDSPAGGIAADSLGPRQVGKLTLAVVREYVDHIVLVSEEAIVAAQQALWDGLRVVAEPGGAAALAALRSGAYVPAPGERVGIVVSGGNTTAVSFPRG